MAVTAACTKPAQDWPCRYSVMEERNQRALSSLGYWLSMDAKTRGRDVFNCAAIGEPTKFQWIVPHPYSHKQISGSQLCDWGGV